MRKTSELLSNLISYQTSMSPENKEKLKCLEEFKKLFLEKVCKVYSLSLEEFKHLDELGLSLHTNRYCFNPGTFFEGSEYECISRYICIYQTLPRFKDEELVKHLSKEDLEQLQEIYDNYVYWVNAYSNYDNRLREKVYVSMENSSIEEFEKAFPEFFKDEKERVEVLNKERKDILKELERLL